MTDVPIVDLLEPLPDDRADEGVILSFTIVEFKELADIE
jgi:hypothetical protein